MTWVSGTSLNELTAFTKKTPLVCVNGVYAKLECPNPTGSVKDRIAKYILDESERLGLLKPGMRIVEATSGNTGIALSFYGRKKGYDVTIVMPEHMTEERKALIRNFGAQLVLCSSSGGFEEAVSIRNRMARDERFFNPDQFSNPLNVECHYRTTGKEILEQIRMWSPSVDAFVAGVGTGGTLMGVARALKEIYPEARIAAVEPAESAVMSGGKPGSHEIPGIGDGFIPSLVTDGQGNLHSIIDEVICIESAAAKRAARELEKNHGFCVGTSSGANYLAAKELADRYRTIVTIFPDGFAKYRSQGLSRSGNIPCRHQRETC